MSIASVTPKPPLSPMADLDPAMNGLAEKYRKIAVNSSANSSSSTLTRLLEPSLHVSFLPQFNLAFSRFGFYISFIFYIFFLDFHPPLIKSHALCLTL